MSKSRRERKNQRPRKREATGLAGEMGEAETDKLQGVVGKVA